MVLMVQFSQPFLCFSGPENISIVSTNNPENGMDFDKLGEIYERVSKDYPQARRRIHLSGFTKEQVYYQLKDLTVLVMNECNEYIKKCGNRSLGEGSVDGENHGVDGLGRENHKTIKNVGDLEHSRSSSGEEDVDEEKSSCDLREKEGEDVEGSIISNELQGSGDANPEGEGEGEDSSYSSDALLRVSGSKMIKMLDEECTDDGNLYSENEVHTSEEDE
jgi:hypothetical protein